MPQRFFTYYWKHNQAKGQSADELLDHAAGTQFRKRGIQKGDFVYVVTLERGALVLLGKMQVASVVHSPDEVRRQLGLSEDFQPWDAPEHLIAERATPVQWARVPIDVVRRLEFTTASGAKPLAFESPAVLDRQTLRGCRRLDANSAELLDAFLPEMQPVERT